MTSPLLMVWKQLSKENNHFLCVSKAIEDSLKIVTIIEKKWFIFITICFLSSTVDWLINWLASKIRRSIGMQWDQFLNIDAEILRCNDGTSVLQFNFLSLDKGKDWIHSFKLIHFAVIHFIKTVTTKWMVENSNKSDKSVHLIIFSFFLIYAPLPKTLHFYLFCWCKTQLFSDREICMVGTRLSLTIWRSELPEWNAAR